MQRMAREALVERSIRVLRGHDVPDGEIRGMMIKNFSLPEETIDLLLAGGGDG
jgi:hypothetical protein